MSASKIKIGTGPTIAYEDTGGRGVPLIFSHGLFMNRTMFEPQIAHFSKSWRCITWDERAHGDTQYPPGDFTYWDSAHDLLALMDGLKIPRAIHVGMSQGGLLGMRAAMLQPKRFVGIVQLATQAGKLAEDGAAAFKAIVEEWKAKGATPDKLQFLTDLILGPGVESGYWHRYWSTFTPRQLEDSTSALYSLEELYDRLHEVIVPLSTIHGLADVSTPYERAERVAREVPDSRGVTLVPGGPHAVNLTHPEVVNAAIAEFVDELARDDPGIRTETKV
jgi:pimeloyl-ACP methyl ester carboxylesterase